MKMVTLAIHKRMRKFLFGNGERSILELEQRGVRSSHGCKESVIENLASNMMKRNDKKEIVELYYDFQKAYDNINHAFLEKLLEVYTGSHDPGMPKIKVTRLKSFRNHFSGRFKIFAFLDRWNQYMASHPASKCSSSR